MNEDEAKKLVEETFSEAYDEKKFRDFIYRLLNRSGNFTELNEGSNSEQYIKESFRNKITSFKLLAEFEDADKKTIDILAVKLKKFSTLERARSFQRNFIADYLNGSRGGAFKDGALVAFYTLDEDNLEWRFSLVQVQYKLEKGKVKKELTSAKRNSFLVGFGVKKTHTAQQQLSSLLTLDNVSLQQLEKAFSVEPVTEEFYGRYKKLYKLLRDHLHNHTNAGVLLKDFYGKEIPPEDFAKHLLGQLVFLYFLQKKQWLGAEKGKDQNKGKKNFLRHLFDKKDYENFYDDKLTYLLHDALATERQSIDYYYEKFDCTIPYLNGGLFEPFCGYDWQNLALEISNDIFNEIFETFDSYNFTVHEDEPLENEVAIDPEMLGKIFENLIPDNERKGSGTFYTPRKIVYYLCQESIIDYLHGYFKNSIPREYIEEFVIENASDDEFEFHDSIKKDAKDIDKALQDVRICDPAIGSGAFPVAMMLEITRLRLLLNPFLNEKSTPYDCKRHCIENCLYGVDLEPSAVDIARLRLWLSLVVDEESFENIEPLPNLDYKIVQADALLGFLIKTTKLKRQLDRLTVLKNKYKKEFSFHKKIVLRRNISDIFHEIYNNPDMLASSPYKVNFDFEVHFFEVFDEKNGFDIILANPPYIQLQKDSSRLAKLYEKCKYDSFVKSGDIYALFYEKAIRLLREGGRLAYITSNKWMRANYGKDLRNILIKETTPLALLDLGANAFDKAAVDTNILITRKEKPLPDMTFHASIVHEHKKQDLYQYMQDEENVIDMPLPEKDGQWLILSKAESQLLEKIESKGKLLKHWGVISRGIITGYNEAFIIDTETKKRLITEDPKSEELIKPILRGKDIKKWHPDWKELYVILAKYQSHKYLKKDYPAIYQHLLEHKEDLKKRGQCRYGGRGNTGQHHWLELDNNPTDTYLNNFQKEKIIYPELNTNFSFIYDENKLYSLKTTYIMTSDFINLKNLTAFLHSNISKFWLSHNCSSVGNKGICMFKMYVENLPIYEKIDECHELGAITDAITNGEDIQKHEARLNQILYGLYGLTDSERKLLENTV